MNRCFLIVLLFLAQKLSAQTTQLVIESGGILEKEKIAYRSKNDSPAEALKESRSVLSKLYEKGYLAASIDSTSLRNNILTAYLYSGSVYRWGKLRKGNAGEEMLNRTGFREKIYQEKEIRPDDISRLAGTILRYYENRGYPFAEFSLDSIEIKDETLYASLNVNKNGFYKIDSILVKGDAVISEAYLYNYISISPGDPYNENLLSKIDTRIKEIPFVELAKTSDILFTETQAILVLYIKKKKASQFNGILGILPDNTTGKIVITGDARIRLKNSFGKGELIDLNWRKLYNAVQDLKVNFNYPFLFGTAFGTDLSLKLYKKDSTFLEVQRNAGLQYHLKGGNFFKVFVTANSTDLLTPSMFENATTLPSFGDVSTTLYGTGIKSEFLDYRLNPRKGISFLMDVSAGNKKIRQNAALPETLYENLLLETNQYQLHSQSKFFIPLLKRSTLQLGNQTAFIINDQLFLNELYRIGGIHTLRGFDEESIFASLYTIATAELRYLPETNSALFLFYDWCYYERKTHESFFSDTPFGFGAGASFQTKAGIFSLSYALGSQQGNPILLRSAKIHFGFINYF